MSLIRCSSILAFRPPYLYFSLLRLSPLRPFPHCLTVRPLHQLNCLASRYPGIPSPGRYFSVVASLYRGLLRAGFVLLPPARIQSRYPLSALRSIVLITASRSREFAPCSRSSAPVEPDRRLARSLSGNFSTTARHGGWGNNFSRSRRVKRTSKGNPRKTNFPSRARLNRDNPLLAPARKCLK